MTAEEFVEKLRKGGTVPLSREEWEGMAGAFPEVERHNTQLAGSLILIRVGKELAAVEEPSREARAARLLGDAAAAASFVNKRLEEYERMWDGCGVKVEYFE